MSKSTVSEQAEKLRQIVIAARKDPSVGPQADQCFNKLNDMYRDDPKMFTAEDVRWVNVLRGTLAIRLAAHKPNGAHAKKAKRKGDQLDHCWRCETPVDERFTEMCTTCKIKDYQWRVCPVCSACGCQRAIKTLV
jgi:hypothetical protein